MNVSEVMTREVYTLSPEMSVKEAAQFLLEKGVGGAPVVDKDGNLVGIVAESDLIMEEVKLQFPTFFHLLDGFIFLADWREYQQKLKKAVGLRVADVMSSPVVTVAPETSLGDAATLMVEKHIGRLPVVKEGQIVGLITKRDLVKAVAYGSKA